MNLDICLSPLSYKVVEKIKVIEAICQTEMECSYVLVELFAMGEHFLKSKYIHLQLFNELLVGFN